MRTRLLACMIAAACGPGPALTAGEMSNFTTTGASEGSSEAPTGETTAPTGDVPADGWTEQPDECGGLYGVVVLPGGDVIAVGELIEPIQVISLPWAVRYTSDGELVWSEVFSDQAAIGALTAVERVEDDVIAVGHRELGGDTPLLIRFTTAGDVVWGTSGAPAEGGLYGAAWSPATARLWAAGTDEGALRVTRYDEDGALADALPVPDGAPTIGYAAAALPDGVVVCGRASTGEGGRLWLGRYAADGPLQWSAVGPDPGVGAFSDCWDVAAWPDGSAVTVEAGYPGLRVARLDPAGTLAWEFVAPNAGAQAVDVTVDHAVVAGWSASMDGVRSHSTGGRHGWIRRFPIDGSEPEHTWLAVDRASPRDVKVHPAGGAVIVGQRVSDTDCYAPWIGRYTW